MELMGLNHSATLRRYNGGVESLPGHDGKDTERDEPRRHARHRIHSSETIGLLLIAVLLLVITLIRYWHHINWSAR